MHAAQVLGLSDTRVDDVTALAAVSTLQSLDLSGTAVADVAVRVWPKQRLSPWAVGCRPVRLYGPCNRAGTTTGRGLIA